MDSEPVEEATDKDDESAPALAPAEVAPQNVSEHDTLKYHLLGPSLTKAGQDTVNQQKVSEIIYNASKGSKFFSNEEAKDKILTEKIEHILLLKRGLERVDLAFDQRRADEYISQLELSRDLSQTIVHVDCDAFYAAVEELDRPELKHVPMAVGKGVLTTCNYHARKYGCRSGMASFVAMKLCPQLICLPMNFDKYSAKANEVRAILADYDPRFESASMDEAYLNITEYCLRHQMDPEDAVSQLRREVHEKVKITVSAGIAANAKIAKIASNKNKPNGQFRVASDRAVVMAFMKDLPVRKVSGVGRVFERELDAIGVKTCGDIFTQRAYLAKLFGEKAFQFLITTYLGLGRTCVRPAEEYERKSVGTESTFRDMSNKAELREKLRFTAEELEKDLARTQFKGRTLVLKVKLHTYEVLTRQIAPPKAVCSADDLYHYSLPILSKLEKEIPGLTLRLMGLRCTHLVSTKKRGEMDFFGVNSGGRRKLQIAESGHTSIPKASDDVEWEVWPEEEFEAAALQERQDEMNDLEQLSQGTVLEETRGYNPRHRHGKEMLPNPPDSRIPRSCRDGVEEEFWECPICMKRQLADDRIFNDHVDFCLSRQTIKDAVKEGPSEEGSKQVDEILLTRVKRKASSTVGGARPGTKQKRLFFT